MRNSTEKLSEKEGDPNAVDSSDDVETTAANWQGPADRLPLGIHHDALEQWRGRVVAAVVASRCCAAAAVNPKQIDAMMTMRAQLDRALPLYAPSAPHMPPDDMTQGHAMNRVRLPRAD